MKLMEQILIKQAWINHSDTFSVDILQGATDFIVINNKMFEENICFGKVNGHKMFRNCIKNFSINLFVALKSRPLFARIFIFK